MNSVANSGLVSLPENFPSRAGFKSLIVSDNIQQMQTGFLPFLPYPVTAHSTVHTAMLNFLKVLNQLKQEFLPVYCDEGVFRIVGYLSKMS